MNNSRFKIDDCPFVRLINFKLECFVVMVITKYKINYLFLRINPFKVSLLFSYWILREIAVLLIDYWQIKEWKIYILIANYNVFTSYIFGKLFLVVMIFNYTIKIIFSETALYFLVMQCNLILLIRCCCCYCCII